VACEPPSSGRVAEELTIFDVLQYRHGSDYCSIVTVTLDMLIVL
jgi:hypothetical protein